MEDRDLVRMMGTTRATDPSFVPCGGCGGGGGGVFNADLVLSSIIADTPRIISRILVGSPAVNGEVGSLYFPALRSWSDAERETEEVEWRARRRVEWEILVGLESAGMAGCRDGEIRVDKVDAKFTLELNFGDGAAAAVAA
jgi:hypothetical protein